MHAFILALTLPLNAVAADEACPDLRGRFDCPPSQRYEQGAMTVEVSFDAKTKRYDFAYSDGTKKSLVADGVKSEDGKARRHFCADGALVSESFGKSGKGAPVSSSRQRINAKGDYEVTGKDGKVSLLCTRAKPAKS